jgi:quercetin dioxygenase-like cupin family protein
MTFHEFGSENELQLAELDFIPHAEAVIHKHDNDEIIYVVSGEMHFGNKILKAGDSIYIPGNTFYSFNAGPNGLRVVNFRGKSDISFYPK